MKLKEIQKQSNFTRKEVADKLNIPISTYDNYLQARAEPDIEMLIKIADIFNVTLDYLCEHKIKETKLLTKEEQDFLTLFYNASDFEKAKIIAYAKGITNQPLTIKDFR